LKITIHNYDNINNFHRSIYEKLYKSRAECYMESKSYHKAVNDYEILVKLKNNNNLYGIFINLIIIITNIIEY